MWKIERTKKKDVANLINTIFKIPLLQRITMYLRRGTAVKKWVLTHKKRTMPQKHLDLKHTVYITKLNQEQKNITTVLVNPFDAVGYKQ